MAKKMTFALAFCNRGFMPGELIYGARDDMIKAGTNAVKELLAKEDVTFFHDLALAAEKAMEADAEKAMRVFAGL